jgi:hypothetical protein
MHARATTVAIAACLICIVPASGAYGQAASPRCIIQYVTQSGTASALILDARYRRANRRAERNWRNYVAARYGEAYANLDRAGSISRQCLGVPGRALAINCSVSAFPCRF